MHRTATTLSLLLASAANALQLNEPTTISCEPHVRKECSSEQDAYFDAVQCLKDAPPKGKSIWSTLENRYDDFVAMHINATRGGQDAPSLVDPSATSNLTQPPTIYGVHTVGVFLPWHRYAIWTFESTLRSECNYTGAQPYWDWTLDNPVSNGSLFGSPVMKAFGGDGVGDSGCIQEGPFAGPSFLNIGPSESYAKNTRCLTRAIDEDLFNTSSKWEDVYPPAMSRKNHYQLQQFIDGLSFVADEDKVSTGAYSNPHSLGHSVIGGDFMDVFASPNDPIFWMHHAHLDYIWALWQKADKARLSDIGGPRTIEGFGPPANATEPTTLDTPLWMGFINDDITVRDVMDTVNGDGAGVLCYEYEDSPSLAGRDI